MHNKLIVGHYDGLSVLFKNMSKRESLATKFFYDHYGKEYKIKIANHSAARFLPTADRKLKFGPFLLHSKTVDRYIFVSITLLYSTVYIDFRTPYSSNGVELEDLFTILQNDGGLSTRTINKILKGCNNHVKARRKKDFSWGRDTHAIKIYNTYNGGRVNEDNLLPRLFFSDLKIESEFFDAISKCKKYIGFEG